MPVRPVGPPSRRARGSANRCRRVECTTRSDASIFSASSISCAPSMPGDDRTAPGDRARRRWPAAAASSAAHHRLVRAFAKKSDAAGRARAGARACGSRPPATPPRVTGAGSSRRPMRANASAITSALISSWRGYAMWRTGSRRTADRPADQRRSGDGSSIATPPRRATPLPRARRARHALAGNRAGDEHHLAVGARDHPAAGGGLLDGQRQGGADASTSVRLIVPPTAPCVRRSQRTNGELETLADQPIDGGSSRRRERVGGHAQRNAASSSSASRAIDACVSGRVSSACSTRSWSSAAAAATRPGARRRGGRRPWSALRPAPRPRDR